MSKSKPLTKMGEQTMTTCLMPCSSLSKRWGDHVLRNIASCCSEITHALLQSLGPWARSAKLQALGIGSTRWQRKANSIELQPQRQGIEGNVNLHMLPGGKSTKLDHKNMRVKETPLRVNTRATTEFAQATLKKVEQITQQNAFSLFIL